VATQVVTSSSSGALKAQATFTVRAGLANGSCRSFESVDSPGSYLRHWNFQLVLNANDNSPVFAGDATFCPQTGANGQGNSFVSYNYPTRDVRHYNNNVYIASNGGTHTFDAAGLWSDDASWVVTAGWSS
jgi:hypothetical protein